MNEETGETPEMTSKKSSSPAPGARGPSSGGAGAWFKEALAWLATTLTMSHGSTVVQKVQTGDVNTILARERTGLAMERSYLAADRTLMAWIRTSLSMISFGFTIGKLGQVMQDVSLRGFLGSVRTLSVEGIAYFLVILGTVALFAASLQHRHRMRALYAMGYPRQVSITFMVALVLIVIGGFALSSLVTAL